MRRGGGRYHGVVFDKSSSGGPRWIRGGPRTRTATRRMLGKATLLRTRTGRATTTLIGADSATTVGTDSRLRSGAGGLW
jgi:hypothetical protein